MSLTAEEMQIMRDKFDMADTDHSGGLDMSDLRVFLEGQGGQVDDEDLSELYAVYDGNHDGILDFDEFVTYLRDVEDENDRLVLLHRFRAIDLDANGVLDVNEIMQFQHLCGNRITLDEANLLLREMDRDNDGLVTLDDFLAAKRR
jgi:Ca2+-binding EF-hand superfamily protein